MKRGRRSRTLRVEETPLMYACIPCYIEVAHRLELEDRSIDNTQDPGNNVAGHEGGRMGPHLVRGDRLVDRLEGRPHARHGDGQRTQLDRPSFLDLWASRSSDVRSPRLGNSHRGG